ncbi:MAG: hypothetical protein E7633_09165 [Ruminococcaceae bacterium]|nr:hypothetical protein [Oscillospiraceae bacterium]
MFFDERIESQSGRIFRKGILFATILTAVFTVCKFLNYREFVFWDIFSFLAEATVILSGVIILLSGEFFRECSEVKDERYYSEKYAYYNKAAKKFLFYSIGGFAGSLLVELTYSSTLPSNFLLIYLELIGFVFISYEFKKKSINLNYSIIDRNNRDYYAAVFKGIGKMATIIAGIYTLPAIYALILGGWQMFFGILLICLECIVSLGVIYLIISRIEKVSRNEEEQSGKIYKCLLISFSFVVGLSVLKAFSQICYFAFSTGDIQHDIPLGQIAAFFSYVNKYFDYYISAFLGLSVSTALFHIEGKPRKVIALMIRYIYTHIIYGFLNTAIYPIISNLDTKIGVDAIVLMTNYAHATTIISYAIEVCFGILMTLLLYALMKQYGYKAWPFILGIIIVAFQTVCFVLRLENSAATYTSIVISDVLQMLLLAGAMIILKGHQKENCATE